MAKPEGRRPSVPLPATASAASNTASGGPSHHAKISHGGCGFHSGLGRTLRARISIPSLQDGSLGGAVRHSVNSTRRYFVPIRLLPAAAFKFSPQSSMAASSTAPRWGSRPSALTQTAYRKVMARRSRSPMARKGQGDHFGRPGSNLLVDVLFKPCPSRQLSSRFQLASSAIQRVAPSFGVQLVSIGVSNAGEIEPNIDAFAKSTNGGLSYRPGH